MTLTEQRPIERLHGSHLAGQCFFVPQGVNKGSFFVDQKECPSRWLLCKASIHGSAVLELKTKSFTLGDFYSRHENNTVNFIILPVHSGEEVKI